MSAANARKLRSNNASATHTLCRYHRPNLRDGSSLADGIPRKQSRGLARLRRKHRHGQTEAGEDLLNESLLLPARGLRSPQRDQDVIRLELLDRVGEGEQWIIGADLARRVIAHLLEVAENCREPFVRGASRSVDVRSEPVHPVGQ